MSKSLRILYAAGPGNVIGTYQHWVKGTKDITFDICGNGSVLDTLRVASKKVGIDSSSKQSGCCYGTQCRNAC